MILLDTNVLVWLRLGDRRLGRRTRRLLDRPWRDGDFGVSAISFWEIAMLVRKGRLRPDIDARNWRLELFANGLIEVPVDGEMAALAEMLPDMHGDPADRMIAATAITIDRCTLLTADERLLAWPGDLDRINART